MHAFAVCGHANSTCVDIHCIMFMCEEIQLVVYVSHYVNTVASPHCLQTCVYVCPDCGLLWGVLSVQCTMYIVPCV